MRLLYEPQLLQTLCGITNAPHVGQVARFGAVIFQFALLLSLLALDVLFFGQIDILVHLLSIHNISGSCKPYLEIILMQHGFVNRFLLKKHIFFKVFSIIPKINKMLNYKLLTASATLR